MSDLQHRKGQGPGERFFASKGTVIVEADARHGGVLFGTRRFATHFLLPV